MGPFPSFNSQRNCFLTLVRSQTIQSCLFQFVFYSAHMRNSSYIFISRFIYPCHSIEKRNTFNYAIPFILQDTLLKFITFLTLFHPFYPAKTFFLSTMFFIAFYSSSQIHSHTLISFPSCKSILSSSSFYWCTIIVYCSGWLLFLFFYSSSFY